MAFGRERVVFVPSSGERDCAALRSAARALSSPQTFGAGVLFTLKRLRQNRIAGRLYFPSVSAGSNFPATSGLWALFVSRRTFSDT